MPARGKKKKRSKFKELLLLLLLKNHGPIGRYALKEMLDMPEHEGIIRYMLTELTEEGYVSSNRKGSRLTISGEGMLEKRLKDYNIIEIKDVTLPFLMSGPKAVGIHIKGKSNSIQSGIEQRDAAIRTGANGATVITMNNGLLSVPQVYNNLASENKEIIDQIKKSFNLRDNDVLIVVSAENRWKALEGALAAAITL